MLCLKWKRRKKRTVFTRIILKDLNIFLTLNDNLLTGGLLFSGLLSGIPVGYRA